MLMDGIGGGNGSFPTPQAQVEVCRSEIGVQTPLGPGARSLERSVPLLFPPWKTVTYLSASFYFSLAECPFLTLQECECILTRGDI